MKWTGKEALQCEHCEHVYTVQQTLVSKQQENPAFHDMSPLIHNDCLRQLFASLLEQCTCLTVSTSDETNTLKGTSLNAACNAVGGETLMSDWQPLREAFGVNGELFAIQCTRRLSLTLVLRESVCLWQDIGNRLTSAILCSNTGSQSWRQTEGKSSTWFMKTMVKWDLLTD